MIHQIIFKVTGRCNLACPYCYYYSRCPSRWRRDFPTEDLERFFAWLPASLQRVALTWHGGEPLLAGLGFFRRAVELARGCGPEVHHGLQTNGLLVDREWAAFFAEHGFQVGVSLDGPPEMHNRRRPAKGRGADSYQGAVRALELLREHGVRHGVLCVVDPEAHGGEVLDHLLGLGVEELELLLPFTGGWTGPEWVEGCTRYLLEALDAWMACGRPEVKVRTFRQYLRTLLGGRAGLCSHLGSCAHYLTMEPDGALGVCECLRVHGLERYLVGASIHTHSFPEALAAAEELLADNHMVGPDPRCQGCAVESICRGGCATLRLPGPRTSPYCELYQAVIGRLSQYLLAEPALAGQGGLAAAPEPEDPARAAQTCSRR
jgi:uncharacterized protein